MNSNIKVRYEIEAKDMNEAIDAKNKIIVNTLENEEVFVKIKVPRNF